MKTRDEPKTVTRRGFLRSSAVAGGAAATGALAGQASADIAQPRKAAAGKRQKKGYSETPHVREYYDKARI